MWDHMVRAFPKLSIPRPMISYSASLPYSPHSPAANSNLSYGEIYGQIHPIRMYPLSLGPQLLVAGKYGAALPKEYGRKEKDLDGKKVYDLPIDASFPKALPLDFYRRKAMNTKNVIPIQKHSSRKEKSRDIRYLDPKNGEYGENPYGSNVYGIFQEKKGSGNYFLIEDSSKEEEKGSGLHDLLSQKSPIAPPTKRKLLQRPNLPLDERVLTAQEKYDSVVDAETLSKAAGNPLYVLGFFYTDLVTINTLKPAKPSGMESSLAKLKLQLNSPSLDSMLRMMKASENSYNASAVDNGKIAANDNALPKVNYSDP